MTARFVGAIGLMVGVLLVTVVAEYFFDHEKQGRHETCDGLHAEYMELATGGWVCVNDKDVIVYESK